MSLFAKGFKKVDSIIDTIQSAETKLTKNDIALSY